MLRWLPPVLAELEIYGGRLVDIAIPPNARDLVLSERAADVLKQAGCSGIQEWDDVEITKVTPSAAPRAPRYIRVEIPLTLHRIDDRQSHAVRPDAHPCETCGSGALESVQRLYFREPNSIKVDAFRPINLGSAIVVSRRLAELIVAHSLIGVWLEPCGEETS